MLEPEVPLWEGLGLCHRPLSPTSPRRGTPSARLCEMPGHSQHPFTTSLSLALPPPSRVEGDSRFRLSPSPVPEGCHQAGSTLTSRVTLPLLSKSYRVKVHSCRLSSSTETSHCSSWTEDMWLFNYQLEHLRGPNGEARGSPGCPLTLIKGEGQ